MSLLLDALQRSEKRPLTLTPTEEPAPELATAPPVPAPAAGSVAASAPPLSAAPPRAEPAQAPAPAREPITGSARQAAQAMVGAAAPSAAPNPQARMRRRVAALLGGMLLAVVSWFGWQYWQTTQTSMVVAASAVSQSAPVAAPTVADAAASSAEPVPSEGPVAAAPVAPEPVAVPVAVPPAAAVSAGDDAPVTRSRPAATNAQAPRRAEGAAEVPAAARPAPGGTDRARPSPPAPRERPAVDGNASERKGAPPPAQPARAMLVRSEAQRHLQNAWTALGQGDAVRAQALYQQVLVERPDDPDATLGLAVSLHRQRQLGPAWTAYQRSLHLWPDNETARTGLLSILSESDPATAESRLQEWVQIRPRDAAAQSALGNLLGRQGRWADALGPLTLAQSLAPERAAHAYNLAVALDQARRYPEALRMYRTALQIGGTGIPVQSIEHRLDDLQEQLAR